MPQDATAIVVGKYNDESLESHFDITLNNKVEKVEGKFMNRDFTEFEGTLISKNNER